MRQNSKKGAIIVLTKISALDELVPGGNLLG
jgi:hypothetical protein